NGDDEIAGESGLRPSRARCSERVALQGRDARWQARQVPQDGSDRSQTPVTRSSRRDTIQQARNVIAPPAARSNRQRADRREFGLTKSFLNTTAAQSRRVLLSAHDANRGCAGHLSAAPTSVARQLRIQRLPMWSWRRE